MPTDKQKIKMGDYFRNMIKLMENNLVQLKKDKAKYSRFKNFIIGINLNIRIRKRQIRKKKEYLARKIKDGWAL